MFKRLYKLRLKLALAVTIVAILYNEWFSHVVARLDWNMPSRPDDGVRLLLIADPQIQGYHYEPHGIIGYITRWDSDRFLRNSFISVLSYCNPDVILFMGDHMDEGSIATDAHYLEYKLRFFSLFRVPENIKVISVPGDNDIGGEGADIITEDKISRFDDAFGKEAYIKFKFVDFVKINTLVQSKTFKNVPKKTKGRVRILLTHIPILTMRDAYAQEVINVLDPSLIFSAHEHRARLVEGMRDSVRLQSIDSMEEKGRIWTIDFQSENLFEIMVPTCSYRMGVRKIGYGTAVIRLNGQVDYTVLWLTERFPQLYVYAATVIFVMLLLLPGFLYRCWFYFTLRSWKS